MHVRIVLRVRRRSGGAAWHPGSNPRFSSWKPQKTQKPQETQKTQSCPCSSAERAPDYESEGRTFESSQGHAYQNGGWRHGGEAVLKTVAVHRCGRADV